MVIPAADPPDVANLPRGQKTSRKRKGLIRWRWCANWLEQS